MLGKRFFSVFGISDRRYDVLIIRINVLMKVRLFEWKDSDSGLDEYLYLKVLLKYN